MRAIVIIAGAAGAGKTSIADALEQLWRPPLARIAGDKFWRVCAKSKRAKVCWNFTRIVGAITAVAAPIWKEGYDLPLDVSMPPGFLRHLRSVVKQAPLHDVGLGPREALRGQGPIRDDAPLHRLYTLFAGAPRYLADDEAGADAIASQIRDGLALGQVVVP
jgi:hypothetical protein